MSDHLTPAQVDAIADMILTDDDEAALERIRAAVLAAVAEEERTYRMPDGRWRRLKRSRR